MAKDISFQWYMPISQVIKDVGVNKNLMEFTGREWYRLYYQFVPYRSGAMAKMVDFMASDSKAVIHHRALYANYQYNGRRFNFNRAVHPLASAFWDRAAMAAGKVVPLAKSMQAYLNRGGK